MTISIQFKSIKVTLTNVEETYVRARYFQANAQKLGLADKPLTTFLDRHNNPMAFTITHDAIHQLFGIATDDASEKVVIAIGVHIMYSSPLKGQVGTPHVSKSVKDLLTGTDSDEAYLVYANLHSMGI